LFSSALQFPFFRQMREEPLMVKLRRQLLGGAGA
jgi:hypothetical protein